MIFLISREVEDFLCLFTICVPSLERCCASCILFQARPPRQSKERGGAVVPPTGHQGRGAVKRPTLHFCLLCAPFPPSLPLFSPYLHSNSLLFQVPQIVLASYNLAIAGWGSRWSCGFPKTGRERGEGFLALPWETSWLNIFKARRGWGSPRPKWGVIPGRLSPLPPFQPS